MARRADTSVRDRLLEEGTGVLHRQGYNGSGVEDITAAAGVPKGSFYNHFASKEAFAVAAVEHYWRASDADTLAILADPALPPLERIRRYFQRLEEASVAVEHRNGCLMGNLSLELADASEAVRVRLSQLFGDWTTALTACLREAMTDGALDGRTDPAALAEILINGWEGAVLRAKVDRSARPYATFRAVILDRLLPS